ncbi:hypothetical protein PR048_011245 [Dryococelus australis]|uniref:Uncharacterized protein n=1 Tax=Dryococelus australis TaxID=614101 RepID=A0ABQ9HL20_9NEOP|nr:hypothetical protein PR048_011245 [Dryococelus australis]
MKRKKEGGMENMIPLPIITVESPSLAVHPQPEVDTLMMLRCVDVVDQGITNAADQQLTPGIASIK